MKENIDILISEFYKIKNRNWIESVSRGRGNVGITFEKMLGKEKENFPIADYNGIEIKTHLKNHREKHITLFSCTFDGPYIFGTQYLKNKYGWSDKELPNTNIFYARISANNITKIKNKYYMKLEINYFEKKIYLVVFNQYYKLIEKIGFWNFDTLNKKIELKIKYLALIDAEKKRINNKEFFRYQNIQFFQLKKFDTFLSLIEKGIIKITFNIGIYKNGKKYGQTYDHGTNFEINIKNIQRLYLQLKK